MVGGEDVSRKRLRLSTPVEVRKSLAKIANMLVNEEIEAKTANSIILACNAILSSIRVDEQQQRMDELERRLDDLESDSTENR